MIDAKALDHYKSDLQHIVDASNNLIERKILSQKLSPFVKKVFQTLRPADEYLHNWHIDLICEYLEAVTFGHLRRLIINIPPRYLKSTIVSVAWPAWVMGKVPSKQIMSASYAYTLAMRDSVQTRSIMQTQWYQRLFPNTVILEGQSEKRRFVTTEGGHRIIASPDGTTTGEGGDILIGDDLLNRKDAESDAVRVSTNEWIDQSFINRLNNKHTGAIVVIMQRLHFADPAGHLLKKESGWEVLSLEGLAEKAKTITYGDVTVRRKKDTALHPEREDEDMLIKLRDKDMGSRAFAGQYQQRPEPLGGNIFKTHWFKTSDEMPVHRIAVLQSWDTAYEVKKTSSYSSCVTFLVSEIGVLVLNVWRGRVEYPELKREAKSQAIIYKPDAVLIEKKASGHSLIQELKRDTTIPIIDITPDKDKIARAYAASPFVEAGRVLLPINAPWLTWFLEEVTNFPSTEFKDVTDAFTQGINYIKENYADYDWVENVAIGSTAQAEQEGEDSDIIVV